MEVVDASRRPVQDERLVLTNADTEVDSLSCTTAEEILLVCAVHGGVSTSQGSANRN
jgi:hypothetical protein